MTGRFSFRLYVSGRSPASATALATAREVANGIPHSDVEVIDVMESPGRAESDRVLATPALLKWRPDPETRVIGDMADSSAVRAALGIAAPTTAGEGDR